jgi:hypothetical protein
MNNIFKTAFSFIKEHWVELLVVILVLLPFLLLPITVSSMLKDEERLTNLYERVEYLESLLDESPTGHCDCEE